MPRIVSVIPPKDDSNITKAQGTKILLDNGEYLRCVHKITLVAEADSPWKAIIEVYPSNQEQINALLADVEVIKRDQEYNRLDEIEKEIQQLQDEKVLIERKHRPEVTGLSIAGVANVPMEGTFLVDKGERVLKPPKNDALTEFLKNNSSHSTIIPPVTGLVKDEQGIVRTVPDSKGEQDDSEEHY
ncbi:hypothetical protein [Acinetobacter baumannii]|uniref:hypothetical protein n=1 Tax=Acinetobacter baumannii TaxID=470 RepID=UPI0002BB8C72|nr:hypothetical protein [Acinetobacter baumannii]ANC37721.1 hypothetical protein Aba3207_14300 [Acinetobacter baumannii]QFY70181.1 hypothetical protein Aba7835_16695 [Acinetobacter baumannii]